MVREEAKRSAELADARIAAMVKEAERARINTDVRMIDMQTSLEQTRRALAAPGPATAASSSVAALVVERYASPFGMPPPYFGDLANATPIM